jgi:tRNA(His) 5'-end guanylyltransferase
MNRNIDLELVKDRDHISRDEQFVVTLKGSFFDKLYTDKILPRHIKQFNNSMLLTANDLIREFSCSSVYVHCNKLVLIFDKGDGNHIFDGKIHKILSVISSFASSIFMCRFAEEIEKIEEETSEKYVATQTCGSHKDILIERIENSNNLNSIATFSAKVSKFENNKIYQHLVTKFNKSLKGVFLKCVNGKTYFFISPKCGPLNQEDLNKFVFDKNCIDGNKVKLLSFGPDEYDLIFDLPNEK